MYGSAYQVATAAVYSHVQLWNPTTDVNVVVTGIDLAASAAGEVVMAGHDTALATAQAYYSGNALIGSAVRYGIPRAEAAAAISSAYGVLKFVQIAVNTPLVLPMTGPLVIPPGKGVLFRHSVVNTTLNANFEWFEEAV